jgi:ribosomal protein S1
MARKKGSKSEKKTKVKKTAKTTAKKTRAKKASTKVKTPKKTTAKKVAVKKKKVSKVKKAKTAKQTPKVSSRGKPKTMEELLKQTGYELKGVKRGQLVEGTVTDISRRMALVDIGAKTEGLVVDKEYEAAKEFIDTLSVGDTITVYILTPENERGQILLSLKKAATDRTWEKYEEALKTGEIASVKGIDVNRGGVIVRADSLQGFVPSSQFGKQWLGKMDELLEKTFKVRVIEVDREKNRLILSEKQVSEADEIKERAAALKQIKVNEVYDGVITGIMPFGVFVGVDVPLKQRKVASKKAETKGRKGKTPTKSATSQGRVGKVEGLVHISEISWEKVENPNRHFRVGQKLKVKILGIDEGSGKLNLSVKRLSQDPWEEIEKNFPQGKKVKGKVSRVAPFGAFINLAPGIEGLLHISKIPSGDEPEVDKAVSVYVEQIDKENRRMSLGMVLTEVPVGYK